MRAHLSWRNGRERCRRTGLTLVELVAGVVILGIAVPPLLTFFAATGTFTITPERQTQAYFLAMDTLETIVADRHAPERGYAYLDAANYPAETLDNGFTRTVTFAEVSAADVSTLQAGSRCLRITVTVTYANPAGSYSLSCIVCGNT